MRPLGILNCGINRFLLLRHPCLYSGTALPPQMKFVPALSDVIHIHLVRDIPYLKKLSLNREDRQKKHHPHFAVERTGA